MQFYHVSFSKFFALINGKYDCTFNILKKGSIQNKTLTHLSKEIHDHDYCRISCGDTKHRSGFSVKNENILASGC